MSATRLMLGIAALAGMGAVAFGLRESAAAGRARQAVAAVREQAAQVRGRMAELEKKLATETNRAAGVENDNRMLAGAVQRAQAAVAAGAAAAVTRESFNERVKQAVMLARSGDPEAAARELLAVYRLGIERPELVAGGMHLGTLASALGQLGQRDPALLVFLRERFDALKRRVLGDKDDTQPLLEMGSIARALKDDQMMVAVYDALPEGDRRRTMAGFSAMDGLVAARRYADALVARPYATMSSNFEATVGRQREAGTGDPRNAFAIKSAVRDIEALAGAGDLAHARDLAARVLALDGSETTRALLQTHLVRAGQPGLLAKPR